MSAVMAVSTVSYSYAAEIELNDSAVAYTEDYEENNGVDFRFIIRETTETEITAREVTLEQLKEEVENGQIPEMAAIVFNVTDSLRAETFYSQQTSEGTEVKEIEIGTQNQKTTSTEISVISLNEEQKSIVYEIAELVPQIVVMTENCVLDNECMFAECTAVKAVEYVETEGTETLDKVCDFDLNKEYAEYLELLALGASSLRRTSGTESESETDTSASSNRAAETLSGTSSDSNNTTSSGSSSSGTTTTTQKNYTITLVPDELLEEEDYLTATYEMTSQQALTYCKVTITYDKNVMTYDVVEESDALEDMTCKVVKSPSDNGGEEGSVTFEFSSTTAKQVNGAILDVYFDLKEPAKEGQEYTLTLTVDTLYNADTTKNLKDEVEVKTETIKAVNDPDLEAETETETTAQTTAQTTTQTETQAPAAQTPTNAPKTGDPTHIAIFLFAMACSAAIFCKVGKAGKEA